MNVDWKAKWIWSKGGALPRNSFLVFTKEVVCDPDEVANNRRVHVSAVSRYRLRINGSWIQDGPARSFPSHQQFDTHDVTPFMQAGTNAVSVMVHYWGEESFHASQHEYGGFFFQMEVDCGDWRCECVSDASWKVGVHLGYTPAMPKAWTPTTFVEAYDARRGEGDSRRGWDNAEELGGAGTDPWTAMEVRSVPCFPYDSRQPVQWVGPYPVRCPNLFIGYNLHPYLLPNRSPLYEAVIAGFVACSINSPCRQRIVFHFLRDGRCDDDLYLNGEPVFNGEPIWLGEGGNLLLCVGKSEPKLDFDRIYPAFTDESVALSGLQRADSPFTVFGPFENWNAVREEIMEVRTEEGLSPWMPHACPIAFEDSYPEGSPWEANAVSEPVPEISFTDEAWRNLVKGGAFRIYASEKPQQVIIDFGNIQCGLLEFEITATTGLRLDFDGFEYMNEGGIQPVWGCALRYIAGEGRQTFLSFISKGFRYLRITVPPFEGSALVFHALKVKGICPGTDGEPGHFESDDARLNEIWSVGCSTLDLCTQDTYVDCPSWEQVCWVGDARITALVDYVSRGRSAVARRTIDLGGQSTERTPEMESHVPSERPEVIPVWSMLWVKMVHEHYQYTGDKGWIKEIYPIVVRMLSCFLDQRMDENGLLSMHTGNLFEWSSMDWENRDCVTHNSIFLAEALRVARMLAEVLDNPSDAIWLSEARSRVVEAINRFCWDDRRRLYVDCILPDGAQSPVASRQVNILALLYDVAPTDRSAEIWDLLKEARSGMVDFASPFGLFFLLEAHAKFGLYELMLETIRRQWGRMLDAEAQTFWEVFPEARMMEGWPSRSYCHVWSAGPVYLLSRHILGISPASPGFDRIRIEPRMVGMEQCRGSVPTPHGLAEVGWKRYADHVEIKYSLPAPMTAELHLPLAGARYRLHDSRGGVLEEADFSSGLELTGGSDLVLRVYGGKKISTVNAMKGAMNAHA